MVPGPENKSLEFGTKTHRLLRWRYFFGAIVASLLLSGCFVNEPENIGGFPRKPIKVIVPFGAGGGSDTFVRILQNGIRNEGLLEHPFVVINVPGAGGAVGSRRVRNALADGHTILCLHEGIFCSKYAGRTPYGPEAFRSIAATGKAGLVVCVREDSEFSDLSELMAAARKRPDEIRFGMAPGTPTHFVGRRLEMANRDNPVTFRNVATGGGAKRFNDLSGGHIDVTPFSIAEYSKFKDSDVRAIAYLGPDRLEEFPEIPTAREQGFDISMDNIQYWWAPKETPKSAVQRIAEVLEAAMATPYVREKLAALKIEPLVLRDDALNAHLEAREVDFRRVALVDFDGLPNSVAMLLGLVILLGILSMKAVNPPPGGASEIGARTWGPIAVASGVLALYVMAMQFFGVSYIVATGVFIPMMGWAVGARSAKTVGGLVAVGFGVAFGCALVFTKLLVVDLP